MAGHSTKQPAPGVTRARIAVVIGVLTALCVKLGLGQVASVLTQYEDPIAAVVLAVAPLVAAHLAKRHTTPLSSPKDADGNDLAPVGSPVHLDAAAAASLAVAEQTYPTVEPAAPAASVRDPYASPGPV